MLRNKNPATRARHSSSLPSQLRIGFDYDGTLAQCSRLPEGYEDARIGMISSMGHLGTISWAKQLLRLNCHLIIVTGRGAMHESWVRRWCRIMLGVPLDVVGRPSDIGLNCLSQAAWKAQVLTNLGCDLYVGDNARIDEAAARIAGIPYLDAGRLIQGEQPRLRDILQQEWSGHVPYMKRTMTYTRDCVGDASDPVPDG